MLIAVRMKDNDSRAKICYSMEEVNAFFFNPSYDETFIIPFRVSGKNYALKKADLSQQALDFQIVFSTIENMYESEYQAICSWFEKMGKRYGLLKEFRENAII